MKGQLSVRGYRLIDLSMFAFLLIVSQYIMVLAAVRWFPGEPYQVSSVAAITAIVMFRWGPYGAIHAVLGGLVLCLASHATMEQYAIYCLGNLFGLLGLLLFPAFSGEKPLTKKERADLGREKIAGDSLKTLLYALVVQVCMQLGRGIMSMILGTAPLTALGFVTTDVISTLFTLLILWIVRRLDGILEEQHHYLLRIARQEQEERKERGGF